MCCVCFLLELVTCVIDLFILLLWMYATVCTRFPNSKISSLNSPACLKMSGMQKTLSTTWTVNGFADDRSRSSLPRETARVGTVDYLFYLSKTNIYLKNIYVWRFNLFVKPLTRWRPRSAIPRAVSLATMMIGTAAEDAHEAAVMIAVDLGALHSNAILGDLRALESEWLETFLIQTSI